MKNYRCPYCKSELKAGQKKSYETLCDHICNLNGDLPERDTYICVNSECCAFHEKHDSFFWDFDGSFYGYLSQLKGPVDTCGTAALGSPEAKMEIELYKKDENYTAFAFRGFRINKLFHYTADKNKNILSRTVYYEFELGHYILSQKRSVIWAILSGLYGRVFRLGSRFWKTKEDRKKGIAENWKSLVNDIKQAWKKPTRINP